LFRATERVLSLCFLKCFDVTGKSDAISAVMTWLVHITEDEAERASRPSPDLASKERRRSSVDLMKLMLAFFALRLMRSHDRVLVG
jgi:hypothetical protein